MINKNKISLAELEKAASLSAGQTASIRAAWGNQSTVVAKDILRMDLKISLKQKILDATDMKVKEKISLVKEWTKEMKGARVALEKASARVAKVIPPPPSPLTPTSPFFKVVKKMSDAELLAYLEETGIVAPWNTLQMQAAEYVQRMTEYPPGSAQFKAAVNNLISTESRRGVLGMTRRAAQRFTTLNDAGGDKNAEFIWVTEGDSVSCDPCISNAAQIKTLAEWEADGLPGAATCDGGDYCRCDLLRA